MSKGTSSVVVLDHSNRIVRVDREGTNTLLSPFNNNRSFARNISVGKDGSILAVDVAPKIKLSLNPAYQEDVTGHPVLKSSGQGEADWSRLPEGILATKVAMAPDGNIWYINNKAQLFCTNTEGNPEEFTPEGTEVRDLSVGADGTVWIITSREPKQVFRAVKQEDGNEQEIESYALRLIRFLSDVKNKTWQDVDMDEEARQISGAPDGRVWIINSAGDVFVVTREGNAERMTPVDDEFALDISVGSDGTVWIVSKRVGQVEDLTGNPLHTGNEIHYLEDEKEKKWAIIPGNQAAMKVAGMPA